MRAPVTESGFTLVEATVAILVVTVGLVAVLAVLSQGVLAISFAQDDLIARQAAREALESIYAARNTQPVTFDMIQNVSAGGIFLDGFQPLREPGPDGLVGTADDGPLKVLRLPGRDGLMGTADDQIRVLSNFRCQIRIAPAMIAGSPSNDLKQIDVTVQYSTARGWQRSHQVQTYVSRFR
jgi:type II secretory pathway pseudopilin PulG